MHSIHQVIPSFSVILHSMHLLPGSHGRGFYKHDASVDLYIDYGMVDLPNADDVIVILQVRVGVRYDGCCVLSI